MTASQLPISFHNTVGLKGKELDQANKGVKSQDAQVLAFFRRHPTKDFTAWEVHDQTIGMLITSVRRAINHLHRDGFIVKLGKRMERYDQPNDVYKLKP